MLHRHSLDASESSAYLFEPRVTLHEFVSRFAYGTMEVETTFSKPYANYTTPSKMHI